MFLGFLNFNLCLVLHILKLFIKFQNIKSAQVWDLWLLRFSWFLHHKAYEGDLGGGGDFLDFFFFIRYSTLLHLPPLRFHCDGGCCDQTQDCCSFGIDSQTLCSNHSASFPTQNKLFTIKLSVWPYEQGQKSKNCFFQTTFFPFGFNVLFNAQIKILLIPHYHEVCILTEWTISNDISNFNLHTFNPHY
jgi:hypothetical protein